MTSFSRHLAVPEECCMDLIISANEQLEAAALVDCWRKDLAELPKLPLVRLQTLRPLALNVTGLSSRLNPWLVRSPHAWSRLYLHEYLPSAARALWLDSDVVVRSDASPLARMRMRRPLAAAVDGSAAAGRGLNSGVLVVDLPRWRWAPPAPYLPIPERLGKIFGHLAGLGDGVLADGFTDQDVLNILFANGLNGGFDVLDWRWNVIGVGVRLEASDALVRSWRQGVLVTFLLIWMADAILERTCQEEAKILHFNWGPKYWFLEEHPPGVAGCLEPYRPKACPEWRTAPAPWLGLERAG